MIRQFFIPRANRYLSLIVQEETEDGNSPTDTESQHKGGKHINDDAILIGLAGFAIILRTTVVALDMGKHGWSERTAPPGVFHLGGVGASALGTGGILSWVLHISSNEYFQPIV